LKRYVIKVAARIACDRIREACRRKQVHEAVSRHVRKLLPFDGNHDEREVLESILRKLPDDGRFILESWARGVPHSVVATALDLSLAAYRSRWLRILKQSRSLSPPRSM
jgi:DNA-directed RNA polymerase specialized sigma24 family protein